MAPHYSTQKKEKEKTSSSLKDVTLLKLLNSWDEDLTQLGIRNDNRKSMAKPYVLSILYVEREKPK